MPHATFRITTEPLPVAGATIPEGQQVLVCLAAANRDPDAFDRPDELDITRPPRAHLAFGHGIHSCLGAPLARLEAAIALGTLLRRAPRLQLAAPRDTLTWTHGDGLVIRGLSTLPVILDPKDRP